jgi:hypothetical protein
VRKPDLSVIERQRLLLLRLLLVIEARHTSFNG